ncbi:MAG: glutaminyl-peptide cyclotransferase [Bacteroidota bacterium]|nr:glutamine cyclotransferase [Odoribacter sp.]MDP3642271.1 glutaminyl-peptide cyclotransferase [Bacteroidota bacterium]
MNFRLFAGFIAFALFISSFSCSNKSNRSRKPAVQITIESVHKKIIYGDDINIAISVKLKDGELQETKIFIDSVQVASGKDAQFTSYLKKFKNLGKHTLKAVAVKTDGVEGVYYKTFEVLSDIIPEQYGYELVQSYPHNEKFFTEGLEIHNGFLYESTGEKTTSAIYKTNLKTGKILQSVKLADRYFGEGITIFNDHIFQLTYKTKIGFIYELENMALADSFRFEPTEGWGMTHDAQNLIMSDGTNVLTYINPETYKTVKKIQVYDDKEPVYYLNELEYSEGFIYANVYTTNLIVKIDPLTGKVIARANLDGILTMSNPDKQVDVLNGIAIDPKTKKMYITGKYYPKLFEIKLVKKG